MKAFILGIVMVAVTGLSSCNTTIGLGRDMRILGANMENSANRKLHGDGGSTASPDDIGGGGGGAPVY